MARPGTVLAPAAMGEQLANGGRFDVHRLGRRRVRDIGRIDICSIKSLPA
jgi:class 3 adenylate cyclase